MLNLQEDSMPKDRGLDPRDYKNLVLTITTQNGTKDLNLAPDPLASHYGIPIVENGISRTQERWDYYLGFSNSVIPGKTPSGSDIKIPKGRYLVYINKKNNQVSGILPVRQNMGLADYPPFSPNNVVQVQTPMDKPGDGASALGSSPPS
jgi:hypothetical protein